MIMIVNPTKSLSVKYGLNGILSILFFVPKGFLEPVWWRNNRWIITNAEIIKGNIKWKAKNRVRVALSTANPPQIHWTIELPK